MINKVYENGNLVPFTNSTGSDIASGDVVVLGSGRVGVACGNIADGETGTVDVQGVFELPKDSTAFAMGASAAIDSGELTATGSGVTTIVNGWVFEAAGSAATTVKFKLG